MPLLKHPGIASLADAGTAGDGVPIDQYCAVMKLTLRQRAALFARVCDAVQYAHQHLVIHRDLKPANLVVGPDGAPRVLGFGIAGEGGTPLFASPEQLNGERLSVASDIYSLGAILYGMLSGRSPNPVEATGIISTLARPAPLPPSEAVAEAVARHYPPLPEFPADEMLHPARKLERQLQGDLDHILMKAIATDPAQRYASADAFARDLERYVAEEPVLAAPASPRRSRKRNRLGMAVAVLAAVGLLAGTGAALWHARQADEARALAEQRFAQSLKPASVASSEIDDALAKAPLAERAKLASAAQAYLVQLAEARRAGGDPDGAQQATAMARHIAEKQSQANPSPSDVMKALDAAN